MSAQHITKEDPDVQELSRRIVEHWNLGYPAQVTFAAKIENDMLRDMATEAAIVALRYTS